MYADIIVEMFVVLFLQPKILVPEIHARHISNVCHILAKTAEVASKPIMNKLHTNVSVEKDIPEATVKVCSSFTSLLSLFSKRNHKYLSKFQYLLYYSQELILFDANRNAFTCRDAVNL